MGAEGFNAYLDGIYAAVEAGKIPSAMRAMEHVRGEVARQTPIETGNLIGSEEVRPSMTGAEIYIPGPYARRQHYGLDFHHNVGNALFLELPMMQEAQTVLRMIADDVRKAT